MREKIGPNSPCHCGSGKKYKKCCRERIPREQVIYVGSHEPLRGLHYDKDKMEFVGLAQDGRRVSLKATLSQTQYISQTGKERVTSRVQDKVIPHEGDLMRHLSSFDSLVAVDTNTKVINGETISVTGIVQCVVAETNARDSYDVIVKPRGVYIFRNCPMELTPEKFGWLKVIEGVNHDPRNGGKRFAIVTDHDLDNHILFNDRTAPIFGEVYLPDNFTLIYGSDRSAESLLSKLIRQCDKHSSEVIKEFEEKGCCKNGDSTVAVNQIPVPGIE